MVCCCGFVVLCACVSLFLNVCECVVCDVWCYVVCFFLVSVCPFNVLARFVFDLSCGVLWPAFVLCFCG